MRLARVRLLIPVALAVLVTLPASVAAQGAAAPAPAPVTTIMAMLKLTPGATREAIMKVMPEEVRDTVRLYLDGRITQWYGRGDTNGVVFMISAPSVEAARALTDQLPLVKAGLATFDFIPLTPLTPLRALLGAPAIQQ